MEPLEVVEKAMPVRPLTELNERECVARLALAVPEAGTIVEVGCLYGGMTAVLGIASPTSPIYVFDNFSWHPADDVPTSAELLYSNMEKVGVKNVSVIEGDSRLHGASWELPINLCWIDGGHSFEYVLLDLMQFGSKAQVIAVHDYNNPYWESIKKAIDLFLEIFAEIYYLDEVAGTVAVLRRK